MKIKLKSRDNKLLLFVFLIIIIILAVAITYAMVPNSPLQGVITKVIRIDEEAYGENIFDSSDLDFRPVLDANIRERKNNVVHIDFLVGGAEINQADNIIYDIALAGLEVDCKLLSPYLKWQLFKNGELISEGSLDYQFDTIESGRLVLTPIQQDLKEFNEDKTTYDYYDFYMWLSDSCQEEDLSKCLNVEEQSQLLGKAIKGKIEVELYTGTKKELVRKPSNELNKNSCVMKEVGDANAD
ncbi:MAG: hypothetical protein IJ509_00310 [Bacilli bacterium]|nr:hypothetical protein [Bacilli bacterium]